MKSLAIFLLALGAVPVMAQEPTTVDNPPPQQAVQSDTSNPISLAGEYLGTNYVNLFGFVDGIYNTSQRFISGGHNSTGGFGLDVGGGVQAAHQYRNSSLVLSYRGDFRDYSTGTVNSGTSQYLAFSYSLRLSRRWSLSLFQTAGVTLYGTNYYSTLANQGLGYNTNPFSPSTRFLSTGVHASYRASPRITYSVGGSFFLNRYNYPGSVGSTGGLGTGSVNYEFTNRTSGGLTYSHDDFYFQRSAGESHINGLYGSASHQFADRWSVTGSFGITRAHNLGNIRIPVEVIFNGVPVIGYAIGRYDTTRLIPTFTGSVHKTVGRYSISGSAGRGVSPGNGTVLTSSNTFLGAYASRGFRDSNLGAAVYYSHLTSISNTVSSSFAQTAFTVSYSRLLLRHISGNASYGFYRYGTLLQINSAANNRFSFGISISSKNIPITLF